MGGVKQITRGIADTYADVIFYVIIIHSGGGLNFRQIKRVESGTKWESLKMFDLYNLQ